MDWGASSWGAAADRGPTMLSFAGPSSSSTASLAAEIQLQDFSVRRGRPAGAGRRSRAAGGGGGGVPEACAVDGCRSDLSRCREYHRRHKVCEAHSKTPVVVVGGQEQRFCQQCSRFHMLSEFDEGKRSCRKRLDGHNRRRRKPQHDIMNLGSFFPYGQVNQFAMYPQSVSRSRQNSDSMHVVDRQQTFSISFSGTFKAPKQFPLSQDGGSMFNAPGPLNLLAEHNSHTRTSSVCNALPRTLGPECALSLLSSSLHRSSPTAVQEQVTSSLACIAAASQDTTATAAAVSYASGVGHHAFVPDALFEDPSQAFAIVGLGGNYLF